MARVLPKAFCTSRAYDRHYTCIIKYTCTVTVSCSLVRKYVLYARNVQYSMQLALRCAESVIAHSMYMLYCTYCTYVCARDVCAREVMCKAAGQRRHCRSRLHFVACLVRRTIRHPGAWTHDGT